MEQRYEPVFQQDEVPEKINGVTLSPDDRTKLMYGECTGMLKDLQFSNGVLQDGCVAFSRDVKGEIEVNYVFKKTVLEIPDEIEGYRLTSDDKNRLRQGETIKMDTKSGVLFANVDKDLNRIVVSTPRQLGIPKEIAGYQLSTEDMNRMANGKKMPNRLFCIDGNYYTAEISVSKDKRGLVFDNYQDKNHLTKDELKTLQGKLNGAKIPVDAKYQNEFQRAVGEKDFGYLLANKDSLKLTDEDKRFFHNNPNLNANDKLLLKNILGEKLSGKNDLSKNTEKIDEKISGKIITENGEPIKEDLVRQSTRSEDANLNTGTKINEKSSVADSFVISNPAKKEQQNKNASIANVKDALTGVSKEMFGGM